MSNTYRKIIPENKQCFIPHQVIIESFTVKLLSKFYLRMCITYEFIFNFTLVQSMIQAILCKVILQEMKFHGKFSQKTSF